MTHTTIDICNCSCHRIPRTVACEECALVHPGTECYRLAKQSWFRKKLHPIRWAAKELLSVVRSHA